MKPTVVTATAVVMSVAFGARASGTLAKVGAQVAAANEQVGSMVLTAGVLLVMSAFFSLAETSITTLYPWKVKEFAAEEGPRSPFAMLDKDITRVLTTVLVATVVCNIGYTAIFADIASARGRDGRTRGLPSASVRRLF